MSCLMGLEERARLARGGYAVIWAACLLMLASCIEHDPAADAPNERERRSRTSETSNVDDEEDSPEELPGMDEADVEEPEPERSEPADEDEPTSTDPDEAPVASDPEKAPVAADSEDETAAPVLPETEPSQPEVSVPEPSCLPDTEEEVMGPSDALPPLPDIGAGPCAFEPEPTTRVNSALCPYGIVHGDIRIATDGEIVELQPCKRITGNVWVDVDQFTYASTLRNVRVIEGSLTIQNKQCRAGETCTGSSEDPRALGLSELRCIGGDLRVSQTQPQYRQPLDLSPLRKLVEVGGSIDLNLLPGARANAFDSLRRVWGDVRSTESFTPPRLETVWGSLSRPNCAAPKFHVGCAEGKPLCSDGIIGCDYAVTSQAGLAGVSECTHVLGDLTLAGTDIVDLSPLAKLQTVRGKLSIGVPDFNFVGTLPSIVGLEALHSVGELVIAKQPLLTDLEGLSGLTTVDRIQLLELDQLADLSALAGVTGAVRQLELYQLPALERLDGLSNAVITDWLELSHCAALHDLTALRTGSALMSIQFYALPKLASLAALGSVETVNYFSVTRVDGLRDLTGLGALREATGHLSITSNARLASLDGMPSLRAVGSFNVSYNPGLRSLRGLDGLTSVTYFSRIDENRLLAQCEVDRIAEIWPLASAKRNGVNVPDATCEP